MKINDFIVLIEGQIYSKNEILKNNKNINVKIFSRLKEYKIIENKDEIVFAFVGLIAYKSVNFIILPKCYKYSGENVNIDDIIYLVKALKVYEKSLFKVSDGNDENFINYNYEVSEIGLAQRLLDDYINNGILRSKNSQHKICDNGLEDWDKTIENMEPIICEGYPVYPNTINKENIDNNLIRSIHTEAVIYCKEKYSWILDYKIDIDSVTQALNNMIHDENRLNIIENIIDRTYKDRELCVLKIIHSLYHNIKYSKENKLALYGTRYFHSIWEEICKFVLNNEYDKYNDFIDNPIWFDTAYTENNTKKTLVPDIIIYEKEKICILDAKYYDIELKSEKEELKVRNNPHMEDILKQFVYEKVFRMNKNLIQSEKNIIIDDICNMFLFPKVFNENNKNMYEIIGGIRLDFFEDYLIVNICLSFKKMLEMYINNTFLTKYEMSMLIKETQSYKQKYKRALSFRKRYIKSLYLHGQTVRKISEDYNIKQLTINKWIK